MGYRINADVAFRACCECSADETYPQHQMTYKRIRPKKTGVEKIPQNNLGKGKNNNSGERQHKKTKFDSCEQPVERADECHFEEL